MEHILKNVSESTLKQWANAPDDDKNFASLHYVDTFLSLKKIGGTSRKNNGTWDFILDQCTDKRKELERVLSYACGFGHAERALATVRKFKQCDAYDIVPEALSSAREQAKNAGINNINYELMDLNNVKLSHDYDLVIAGGIHHIKNLEQLFSETSSHLLKGGVFQLYEYIGETQCQPTQRTVEIINACIQLIPPIYRVKVSSQRELHVNNPAEAIRIIKERDLDVEDYLWSSFTPMTREQWDVHDPSEAVRSNEIIPLLKENFDSVEVRYSGGTIVQFAIHDIAKNFAIDTMEARNILDMLWNIEQTAIKYDDVPENYAFIIARNLD